MDPVLTVAHYEKHEIDVTEGAYQEIEYNYLSIIQLSLDGAEQSEPIINKIERLYEAEPSAHKPAVWLYYPVSEKVGRDPVVGKEMLTLAFANPLPGTDIEFREWYCIEYADTQSKGEVVYKKTHIGFIGLYGF